MIKQSLTLLLVLFIGTMPAAFAAGDPMKSLFLFQQKMAESGSPSAMMKMGEMYERGDGVAQSLDNALMMYKKAVKAGNKKALYGIERVKKAKRKQPPIKKETIKKQPIVRTIKKVEKKKNVVKVKKINIDKEKLAKIKAAEQEKANKAKIKAAAEKAKRVKFKKAAAKKAKIATLKEKQAREKAAAALKIKETKAKAAAARIKAAKKRKEQEKKKNDGFKSDPCKGKAARLLSICR